MIRKTSRFQPYLAVIGACLALGLAGMCLLTLVPLLRMWGSAFDAATPMSRFREYQAGGVYDGGRCAFSPKRQLLFYSSPSSGGGDIVCVNVASGRRFRLTECDAFEADPVLNDEENVLVYGREENGHMSLWAYEVEADRSLQLTDVTETDDGGAEWDASGNVRFVRSGAEDASMCIVDKRANVRTLQRVPSGTAAQVG